MSNKGIKAAIIFSEEADWYPADTFMSVEKIFVGNTEDVSTAAMSWLETNCSKTDNGAWRKDSRTFWVERHEADVIGD